MTDENSGLGGVAIQWHDLKSSKAYSSFSMQLVLVSHMLCLYSSNINIFFLCLEEGSYVSQSCNSISIYSNAMFNYSGIIIQNLSQKLSRRSCMLYPLFPNTTCSRHLSFNGHRSLFLEFGCLAGACPLLLFLNNPPRDATETRIPETIMNRRIRPPLESTPLSLISCSRRFWCERLCSRRASSAACVLKWPLALKCHTGLLWMNDDGSSSVGAGPLLLLLFPVLLGLPPLVPV